MNSRSMTFDIVIVGAGPAGLADATVGGVRIGAEDADALAPFAAARVLFSASSARAAAVLGIVRINELFGVWRELTERYLREVEGCRAV